jgi:hypothetical protein
VIFRSVSRKAASVLRDPVLRRWILGAVLGRWRRPAPFTPNLPSYLRSLTPPADTPAVVSARAAAFHLPDVTPPSAPLVLALPGETVTIDVADPAALFAHAYPDTETLLAVHRFAWLPLTPDLDSGWVDALWRAWTNRFATPDKSWAWHPYTAAERAINILDFSRRRGLPGDRDATLALLARHAAAIARQLEYFGDHDTGNHLSNNGRGLYLLGLALGLPDAVEMGARILLAEAARIFRPSGVLREGSSHYHLLLVRNYVSAWLAARRHGRPEAETLGEIVRRAFSVLPHLVLPGGMPLVGDISPDCPPGFLAGLLPGGDMTRGWCAMLEDDERAALARLNQETRPVSPDRLAADGWVRFIDLGWAALWHVAPDGWPPMPGHAHQDMGSLELHYGDEALFVDPGRGAYGEADEAGIFTSGAAHNSLLVNGRDPYPPNKPYYDVAFRRTVCGPPPRILRRRDGLTVAHNGFSRLAGVGEVERRFVFAAGSVSIVDRIEGSREKIITRRLHTPLPARLDGEAAVLEGQTARFRISADGPITVTPGKRWTAYGIAAPASVLEVKHTTRLPVTLRLAIEVTS